MDIGEQADAQPAERCRQRSHQQIGARDREVVAPIEESVRGRAGCRADTRREQRFQNRPTRHHHRVIA
jgi:hypothetical protein